MSAEAVEAEAHGMKKMAFALGLLASLGRGDEPRDDPTLPVILPSSGVRASVQRDPLAGCLTR